MRLKSVTFIVRDIEKSLKFYEKLGFKVKSHIKEEGGERIVFATDDPQQELIIKARVNHKEEPGKQICTFFKENASGYFQKCKIMGVAFEKDLRDSDHGKTFMFGDLDGNKIEVFEKPVKKVEKAEEEGEVKKPDIDKEPIEEAKIKDFKQFTETS